MPYKLMPTFQTYPWGSKSYIQTQLGLPEFMGNTLAEMWLGAHPKAPGSIEIGNDLLTLNRFISNNPQTILGAAATVNEGQLPFLLKVLAADEPLSIQVHPDKATAMRGFADEDLAGIALDDPQRSFKDNNHKPEMMFALTKFDMMCGFRAYREIIDNFCMFALESLWQSFTPFAANPSPLSLKNLFTEVLSSTIPQLEEFSRHIYSNTSPAGKDKSWIRDICLQLISIYNLDVGIVSPLLLNLFQLNPGEAIYLEAGILHAYLKGAGIELMANSDNVIRGGLTPKFIDKDTLFSITNFQPFQPAILLGNKTGEYVTRYHCPVQEFELQVLNVEGKLTIQVNNKPQILLWWEGEALLNDGITLHKGESAFVTATETELSITGNCLIFLASLP
ncbi:MAG: mannose-6-phosphate isomerase, class I [Candidatus Cloacimonetes bacterium]|nr:mannose-6-phosphate isomerase, class I [Candidatus Cloacimonadota bacterium]